MEVIQEKVVDEAEAHENVDYWLDSSFKASMDEVLATFREEYLTILGSNSKYL